MAVCAGRFLALTFCGNTLAASASPLGAYLLIIWVRSVRTIVRTHAHTSSPEHRLPWQQSAPVHVGRTVHLCLSVVRVLRRSIDSRPRQVPSKHCRYLLFLCNVEAALPWQASLRIDPCSDLVHPQLDERVPKVVRAQRRRLGRQPYSASISGGIVVIVVTRVVVLARQFRDCLDAFVDDDAHRSR